MALRQALCALGRRSLQSGALRLAPLAAATTQAASALTPAPASGAWSAPSRGMSAAAEAVAEREAKLPETTGWGSTRVGALLKAKVGAGGRQGAGTRL